MKAIHHQTAAQIMKKFFENHQWKNEMLRIWMLNILVATVP
jgi:hypothetical protein